MKKIVAVLLLMSMIDASVCFAEEPSPKTPAGTNSEDVSGPPVLSPLQKGQAAPYSGILFSPRAAAQIAADISSFPEKLKIETETAVKNAVAKKDFEINDQKSRYKSEKTQLEANIEANQQRINGLAASLADAEARAANAPNPYFWFGVGAGTGVAVTIASALAVVYATK